MMAIIGFVIVVFVAAWMIGIGASIIVGMAKFSASFPVLGFVMVVVGVVIEILAFHHSPFSIAYRV